ncbi:MAG: hypothetical protein WCT42_04350 [Candidatus Paceibacterota bacterium]
MAYVITCGDEGVQINEGTRLGVVGCGFHLDGASQLFSLLKKTFNEDLRIAINEESDWIKKQLDLVNWEQVNAMAQQQIQALADDEGVLYAGYLPFTDPRQLQHEIKGHMVRPHKVHIANTISFTLGGGEQKFHLGHYVISADWVHLAKPDFVKKIIAPQIEFYTKLNKGEKLNVVFEEGGDLGPDIAAKNKTILEKVLGQL